MAQRPAFPESPQSVSSSAPTTDNYTLDDLAQVLRSIPKISDFPTLNQAVDTALEILTNVQVRVHVFLRRKVGTDPTPSHSGR